MKTFVVSAVSIVLVGILFCPMVMAAPSSMPADLQMVQPDPSLPKELSAFFGKWECDGENLGFVIVEKIDEEKASLYVWERVPETYHFSWFRHEAQVIKERGKCKLWYTITSGNAELTVAGKHLNFSGASYSGPSRSLRLIRVP